MPVIRRAIRDIDPDQTLGDLSTSAVKYAEFFDVPRFNAWLISSLALIGLAIGAVGLYGLLAYVIALRTREFGIRMALGAGPSDVLQLVLRNGASMNALGIFVGTLGSLILTRGAMSDRETRCAPRRGSGRRSRAPIHRTTDRRRRWWRASAATRS